MLKKEEEYKDLQEIESFLITYVSDGSRFTLPRIINNYYHGKEELVERALDNLLQEERIQKINLNEYASSSDSGNILTHLNIEEAIIDKIKEHQSICITDEDLSERFGAEALIQAIAGLTNNHKLHQIGPCIYQLTKPDSAL